MSALDVQVSGNHYKQYKVQPIEFYHAQNIPFIEANVIKYTLRHRDKNGAEDIRKAIHYLRLRDELGHLFSDLICLDGVKDFIEMNDIRYPEAGIISTVCAALLAGEEDAKFLRMNAEAALNGILKQEYGLNV